MPKINSEYDIGAAFQAIENELIASMIRNMRRHKIEEIDEDKLPNMTEEEQLRLLATDGMLVKRPFVVDGDLVLTGFREAEWKEKLI